MTCRSVGGGEFIVARCDDGTGAGGLCWRACRCCRWHTVIQRREIWRLVRLQPRPCRWVHPTASPGPSAVWPSSLAWVVDGDQPTAASGRSVLSSEGIWNFSVKTRPN